MIKAISSKARVGILVGISSLLLLVFVGAIYLYLGRGNINLQQGKDISYGVALKRCLDNSANSPQMCKNIKLTHAKFDEGFRDPSWWTFEYSIYESSSANFSTTVYLGLDGKILSWRDYSRLSGQCIDRSEYLKSPFANPNISTPDCSALPVDQPSH